QRRCEDGTARRDEWISQPDLPLLGCLRGGVRARRPVPGLDHKSRCPVARPQLEDVSRMSTHICRRGRAMWGIVASSRRRVMTQMEAAVSREKFRLRGVCRGQVGGLAGAECHACGVGPAELLWAGVGAHLVEAVLAVACR